MKVFSFALGIVLLASVPAQGGFLAGFAGNSYLDDDPAGDAHVSFAVYENNGTSGNWVTDLGLTGLASTTLGATDDFVYFYQVVNSNLDGGATDSILSTLSVDLGSSGVASTAGHLTGTVFAETFGSLDAVNDTNFGLGAVDSTSSSSPNLSDGAGFTADAGAADPIVAQIVPGSSVNFTLFPLASTDLPTPGLSSYSSVVFFTSSQGPTFGSGSVSAPTTSGGGGVPVPVPEPATVALAIVGLPLLMGMKLRRRRQESQA